MVPWILATSYFQIHCVCLIFITGDIFSVGFSVETRVTGVGVWWQCPWHADWVADGHGRRAAGWSLQESALWFIKTLSALSIFCRSNNRVLNKQKQWCKPFTGVGGLGMSTLLRRQFYLLANTRWPHASLNNCGLSCCQTHQERPFEVVISLLEYSNDEIKSEGFIGNMWFISIFLYNQQI